MASSSKMEAAGQMRRRQTELLPFPCPSKPPGEGGRPPTLGAGSKAGNGLPRELHAGGLHPEIPMVVGRGGNECQRAPHWGECLAYTPSTHARKDVDRLLLEFSCNPTRTHTV
jgi:hypothetical protein